MSSVAEIAPDIFRINVYVPEFNLGFSHFLLRDDEPVLFHTGTRRMFPAVREAVAGVLDPASIRWISFSHFEADECGALNHWLDVAPHAEPVCSLVGALVSINDFSNRPARVLDAGATLNTGRFRLSYHHTPHLPHGWDAGVMFEENTRTLLCSDLFHQDGDVEPLTRSDVLARVEATLRAYQLGPFANYVPYTANTGRILERLSQLQPQMLATMHGSCYEGNGARALLDLALVMKRVLGENETQSVAA